MHLVDSREVFLEKAKRRAGIKELEVHARGHCIHVGQISFGCGWCFAKKELFQLSCGDECMCRDTCVYCFFGGMFDQGAVRPYRHNLPDLVELASYPQWRPELVSYNSWGETLLAIANGYEEVFLEAASIVNAIEQRHQYKVYKKLYTNGLLATDDMLTFLKNKLDVTEIRFHLSASNFSEIVYQHMRAAQRMGFVVVVEEPSLPSHREPLFEMLPRIDAIGVKHLDICEVEITQGNIQRLHALFPDGRMYRDGFSYLCDEGLVYDLIEEVVRRGYGFSVIDCNSERKRWAFGRSAEGLFLEDVWNMYAVPFG